MQKNAMLTRESRRIIDSEEANTDVLIRAYLLTKDRRYADEAVKRVKEMATWGDNKNVVGDFNEATLLSLCSMAYDALYDVPDDATRKFLLNEIKEFGNSMYMHNINRLENHIADNHVWQMTFRILTMAAFTVYGELPEADAWTDYCYNLWLARFPGLNKDGAWHNGDSHFHVNIRTLVEVPYSHTRLTGFNYFSDPWYQGNALYVIYQAAAILQIGRQRQLAPEDTYPERYTCWLMPMLCAYDRQYIRRRLRAPHQRSPARHTRTGKHLESRRSCMVPPAMRQALAPDGPGLKDLPMGHVFPQSGLASFSTNLDDTRKSAMLSFRSSPYGSTSHAIANQNAFNTFWNGQSLFYSSGHHTSFTDIHGVYCHRATRAHNTILVNGMGQRIGTEGYGWIPRYYVSDNISYVAGDASNAYGKVISPLWLLRGKQSNLEFSPENGWDDTSLKIFRRHIVTLGKSGYSFIYDELEAEEPVTWSYQLHTVTNPMNVNKTREYVHIRATSKDGASDAYLFSSGTLETDTTSRFFVPAVNWLRADEKGHFAPYPNHWHFTATSDKQKVYRFATIVYTHAKENDAENAQAAPRKLKDGSIQIGDWNIKANISTAGKPSFEVRNTRKDCDASVSYKDYGATVIHDNGKKTELKDEVPELEI